MRESDSLHLAGTLVRRAFRAGRADDRSELVAGEQGHTRARRNVAERDQGGSGGRLVGAVEE